MHHHGDEVLRVEETARIGDATPEAELYQSMRIYAFPELSSVTCAVDAFEKMCCSMFPQAELSGKTNV